MSEVAKCEILNGVGILTIDNPPVNALGVETRTALGEGFRNLSTDPSVKAIVLTCGGRTFFAGADISEFNKGPQEPSLTAIFDMIENCGKPVIAAIHGTALGGGFELALVCNYRVAVRSAKVGLPEVKLGILPALGGTQRLPRIVGVEAALDIITGGNPINATKAQSLGMIDALADEGQLREEAIAFARRIVDEGKPLVRIRDLQDKIAPAKGKPEIFAEFRKKKARAFRGLKAPEGIIQAVEAAVELPFEEGLKRERELFEELKTSIQSQALRYVFFSERMTSKVPDIPDTTPTIPIKSVGVIGAGTMGGGIAMNFLNVGVPVTLVDLNEEVLDRGIGVIRKNYENSARKGHMTEEQVEQRMALISPALDLEAIADADLVIEAVFEQMSIKKDIFEKIDKIAKPGAILASNTSYLDLDEIASVTSRPESVVGLHFFSPANVMRLLEVVRGARTSMTVISTCMKLAKEIAKVPVLSRVCPGFIANRIMSKRSIQTAAIILEGPSPADVDKVVFDYGFAMGPFQVSDLVGLDVIGRDETERTVRGDLVKLGRLGQKNGGGYYDYDEKRNATPSPVAAKVIAEFAKAKGAVNTGPQSSEEILDRLLYPIVNESAKLLEEGVAVRASDIDIAAILGYNWPAYTGGPLFWADTIGLPKIVAKLRKYEARYGEEFKPSSLLVKMAEEGKTFTRG